MTRPLRLTVEGFGSGAEGVCRHEGKVVFVEGALPGETIEAQVLKSKNSVSYAKLLRILEASPDRRDPPCGYYPRCGGCSCQHMSYAASLAFKRGLVADSLRRIGGIDVPVPEVLPMDPPWHYRNKAAMPVRSVDGAARAGFFMRRSHRIVPVEECLISSPLSDAAVREVLQWMALERIPPYDEATGTGTVRHVLTRVSQAGAVMVTLVINARRLPGEGRLVGRLRAAVPGLVSLNLSCNLGRDNVIPGEASETVWGAPRMEDRLCGLRLSVSPLSFFQVNPRQTERLYEKALAFAAPEGGDTAVDVCCGTGTITLLLARRAKQAFGIEISAEAVRDANDNAASNGIRNVSFLQGPAEELLPELVNGGVQPDVVILDPPRKGTGEAVLDAIVRAAPGRIVYVSCHPATQARDAKRLVQGGYRVGGCFPVDMFCQTAEVENILLLTRDPPP